MDPDRDPHSICGSGSRREKLKNNNRKKARKKFKNNNRKKARKLVIIVILFKYLNQI